MTCATCGRTIVPCPGAFITLGDAPAPEPQPSVHGLELRPCSFGRWLHADSRTPRAGSHLCGRSHGSATAQPRSEAV